MLAQHDAPGDAPVEIIAFYLGEQQFCVETTAIREIRGWTPATPVPHAPAELMGVMNLRGSVIPIIDVATRLGMAATAPSERSAIVVAEIRDKVVGLVVERVSDILTIPADRVQPMPVIGGAFDAGYARGIIALDSGMVCFLDLAGMFGKRTPASAAA
jgi:purine-binding chemotaxis protein CheW